MMNTIELLQTFASSSWQTLLEMAPYLLFGFLVAGILSELISPSAVERHLGARGVGSILKAAALGIPLPLCSCGVIPVTVSIRRHGASRGATLSFLLSTPQTGVDSIMVTYSLLGWVFALVRPLVALVCGVFGGFLAEAVDGEEDLKALEAVAGDSSGSKGNAEFALPGCDTGNPMTTAGAESCSGHCSCGPSEPAESGEGFVNRAGRAVRYGFVTIPADIAGSLAIGIVLAGAISALVPQGYLETLMGKGIAAKIVMMAVGIPLYVCATASVPIAAALMAKGVSAGAALVFLMTGPVTNAASLTTVTRIMGARTTAAYLFTVIVVSLGAGTLMDLGSYDFSAAVSACLHNEGATPAWKVAAGIVLVAVMIYSRLAGRAALQAGDDYCCSGEECPDGAQKAKQPFAEEELVLMVSGMTCSHCEGAVVRNVAELPGVSSVTADRTANMVVVTGSSLDSGTIIRAINALGYATSPPNDGPGDIEV